MAKKLALIIGIENYPKRSGQDKVSYAINDAWEIADYAKQAGFYLINHGKPLVDKEATYTRVVKMLKSLTDYSNPEDFILIYYAGHGHYAEDGGYLIPFDYQKGNDVDESCCISFDSFEKRFKDKKTSRFIFFLDTCHSGFAGKQLDIRSTTTINEDVSPQVQKKIEQQMNSIVHLNESSPNVARVIFTSSGSHEKSHSIKELKHGLFTYYLLSNLKIKKGKLQINVEELILKVKTDIEKYCIENSLAKQTPTAYTRIEGMFLIPAYEGERKDKYKKIASKPGISGIPGKTGRKLKSESISSNEKINDKKSNDGEDYRIKSVRGKKKHIIIFLSILLIVLIAITIFIKAKIDKAAEIRKSDNQAYEKAIYEDTKDSYGVYISQHPFGLYLEKAKKRLEELEKMFPDVYRLHLDPKIEVSKNKKGYWEAHYTKYGIRMVYIPEGNFKMGQTEKEKEWLIINVGKTDYNKYYKNETPNHDIFLSGYWMGKTEVTNEQYVTFLNDSRIDHKDGCQGNPCIDTKKEYQYSHIMGSKGEYYVETGYKKYPVTDISWYGAGEYCKWLSKKTGFDFKLPTEAQWEKAARWFVSVDRSLGFMFPWGDYEPGETLANFNSEKIAAVDSYHEGVSPFGLLNMAGNVWEWCSDWYDENYYSKSPKENPQGPENGKYRVRRGGGWNNMSISLRCAGRKEDTPSKRYSNVGSRLCQGLKDVVKENIKLP